MKYCFSNPLEDFVHPEEGRYVALFYGNNFTQLSLHCLLLIKLGPFHKHNICFGNTKLKALLFWTSWNHTILFRVSFSEQKEWLYCISNNSWKKTSLLIQVAMTKESLPLVKNSLWWSCRADGWVLPTRAGKLQKMLHTDQKGCTVLICNSPWSLPGLQTVGEGTIMRRRQRGGRGDCSPCNPGKLRLVHFSTVGLSSVRQLQNNTMYL